MQQEVNYEVVGDAGVLSVKQQGLGEGVPTPDACNDWDLRLNDAVPIDLGAQMGGAGEVAGLLPSRVGVRVNARTRLGRINADGLRKHGEAFVNDAYGDSDVALGVDVQGGVGQINLNVV